MYIFIHVSHVIYQINVNVGDNLHIAHIHAPLGLLCLRLIIFILNTVSMFTVYLPGGTFFVFLVVLISALLNNRST